MFKRTLFRLLRVVGICVGLLVTSVCVAGYLALREPAFYRSLRQQEPTHAQVEAAGGQMQRQRDAYLHWRAQVQAAGVDRPGRDPVPVPPAHVVRFRAEHLNTLLAEETQRLAGGAIEDPRVRVTPDRVAVACGLLTPAARCVLSAELKPSLTPDGVVTLELVSAKLGSLPIPCDTLLGFFPRESHRLSGNLYLDLTAPKPRITLDLSDKAKTLLAESIECGDGEVTVRFVARPAAG